MSEYQYYEFRAVDRRLTPQEQAELRKLSTRAEITDYQFTNVYHWGNFKGSPLRMMEQYFDAHLYVATWGRTLMLRLPRKGFDPGSAHPYLAEKGLSLHKKGRWVIVTFEAEDEAGEDLEGEKWLASLLPLRQELLAGDLRCLYIGWLAGLREEDEFEEAEAPPVPPGMRSLTSAQAALAEFLLIPESLLEAAAQASQPLAPRAPRQALEAWVKQLPLPEKNKLLVRVMEGKDPHLEQELLQRFQKDTRGAASARAPEDRRTGEDLKREAEAIEGRRRQRVEKDQAAMWERHLEALAAREVEVWKQVAERFATRSHTEHDAGVQLLADLKEVARRRGTEEAFTRRIHLLREQNARRHSLLARMDQAGLSRS
ncbi:hypothetical protein [Stigmatella aurantiaca]|uniref:Conserved uncharacterized protein n=1 Tax=Stigmatella aurantiaca (strain DW4/3-1) TaxID=378806 RepID=Q09DU3_STIAD|nr:hypothetical protein [Stigmatella aurantiaca]ADO75220.1 conserved uncharacterized protein [Stigmatella aurantiaca DW4/3-1]EAU69856.1 conserved hypothetical protein [Stigmatella aurantiaca DW4/3-1]